MSEATHMKGAVLDLDGVITQTAEIHFQAWKQVFDELLEQKIGDDATPFRHEEDYIPYVDGKPRYQGVKSFLESRDISLPFGKPGDKPGDNSICAVGNQKNECFRKLIKNEGAEVFESSVKLVDQLKERGVAVGVASSSKNATFILEQTGLKEKLEAIVDGNVVAELGLSGKPAPDVFLLAAERLGVAPAETMMAADACAGVEAGQNGRFGLVIGVARGAERERLHNHGADLVVEDLSEISIEEMERWFRDQLPNEGWQLTYHGFHDDDERLREAMHTVGNGYFGTRGSLESEPISDNVHNPGTYIAGLFDRAATKVRDKTIYNNDFVNCPDWTRATVHISGDHRLSPHTCEVVSYRQWLDLSRAILHRDVTYRDRQGRITRVATKRFASMKLAHLGVQQITVVPTNHNEPVEIKLTIDGDVKNYLVERYRDLEQHHIEVTKTDAGGNGVYLEARTLNSKHEICMRATSRSRGQAERKTDTSKTSATESYTFNVESGSPCTVERFVAIHTGIDFDTEDPVAEGKELIEAVGDYKTEEAAHVEQWQKLWDRADMVIEGDRFAQRVARLHTYHLLATASLHNTKLDVGLPARGLHGEAYRGHIFWDEVFILPFYVQRFPEIARSHLLYRYRRLDEARKLAKKVGCKGAMYPWQSADTGGPESQELHYNPKSGEWDPDLSDLQRHISISISYDVYTYFYATDDREFLHDYGMEMLLEIGRYWASKAKYDESDERYHIEDVMGPDEFHEKYPDAPMDQGGFRDNAYTNIMAAWLLHKIAKTYEKVPDDQKGAIDKRIEFDRSELDRWEEVVSKLAVPFADDYLISQFEGYMELEELDWDRYREKYDNIRRLDRILKAEGDSPDRYKVSKQADVLMTFYLLAPEQVEHILELMGYPGKTGRELLRRNYDYYVKRTSHGSTLSWIAHSDIVSYIDEHKNDQWKWFVEALRSDIFDTQGGTTLEGIHCGVMAGSLDIVVSGFCGISLFRDRIELDPNLPDDWKRVSFCIQNQGVDYRVEVERTDGKKSSAYVTRLSKGKTTAYAGPESEKKELPVGERVAVPSSREASRTPADV
ncbi:MAG: beta-phosphoglucomutase family hydrolase [Spirochaetota bacterium]